MYSIFARAGGAVGAAAAGAAVVAGAAAGAGAVVAAGLAGGLVVGAPPGWQARALSARAARASAARLRTIVPPAGAGRPLRRFYGAPAGPASAARCARRGRPAPAGVPASVAAPEHKKRRARSRPPPVYSVVAPGASLAIAAHALEAARAVDGLVGARLERHVGHAAALRAHRLEHLARAAGVAAAVAAATAVAAVAVVGHATAAAHAGLARGAALRAAPGLVGEALLREELLLPGRESELLAALPADERTIDETHECLLETLGWVKAEAS